MVTRSTQTDSSFQFGATLNLTNQQRNCLIGIFKTPAKTLDSGLMGRSSIAISHLNGIGSVVVKCYTRGGIIRYLVKRRYLKWGKTRGEIEFEILQKVRRMGVRAPEPIAYAFKGRPFYRAWLVSRKIEGQQTLAALAREDEYRASLVMGDTSRQIAILINHHILHVDLHPGNVLVDRSNRVFLIDFDKACLFRKNQKKLRDRYLNRWHRAVIKHRLPSMLIETLNAGLSNPH